MTVQMRPRGSQGLFYSPARDIAYLHRDVALDVAKRLDQHLFPPLHAWLETAGVTDNDLFLANEAYTKYLLYIPENPNEQIVDVLQRAGWFDVKPEAQIAYMFYVGQAVSGSFFPALRDVLKAEDEPPIRIKQLVTAGRRLKLIMSMSRWTRFWYRWLRPLRRWWRRCHKIGE